jgi:hypothetical protein
MKARRIAQLIPNAKPAFLQGMILGTTVPPPENPLAEIEKLSGFSYSGWY